MSEHLHGERGLSTPSIQQCITNWFSCKYTGRYLDQMVLLSQAPLLWLYLLVHLDYLVISTVFFYTCKCSVLFCRSKRQNMEFCTWRLSCFYEETAVFEKWCICKWRTWLCLKGKSIFQQHLVGLWCNTFMTLRLGLLLFLAAETWHNVIFIYHHLESNTLSCLIATNLQGNVNVMQLTFFRLPWRWRLQTFLKHV